MSMGVKDIVRGTKGPIRGGRGQCSRTISIQGTGITFPPRRNRRRSEVFSIGQTNEGRERNRFPTTGVLTTDSLYLYLIRRVRNEVRQLIEVAAQVLDQSPVLIRGSLVLEVVSRSQTSPVDRCGVRRYVVSLHRLRFVASRSTATFGSNRCFPTGSERAAIRMPLDL